MIWLFSSCLQNETAHDVAWQLVLPNLGSSSSPRAADLNGDGILDIVLGSGKLEFEQTDTAILAIDGRDGRLLWYSAGIDQIFGSAIFLDINNDQISEVFIGGRSGQFYCVDGQSGDIVWTFDVALLRDSMHERSYNFYNSQWVGDLDDDGFPDILTAYGGDVLAKPNQINRPPGRLVLVSSLAGELINQAEVPDQRETYMSPLILEVNGAPQILFGTGGETIGGRLFMAPLSKLLQGDLSQAKTLATSEGKGFVAPPVLVDLNLDEKLDVVVNGVDGRTVAIDLHSHEEIWNVSIENTEIYGTPAVGFFNADSFPDLFVTFGVGQFPQLLSAVHVMIDSKDGSVMRRDTLGTYHYGSAVAYDVDDDGIDEIIYHANIEEMGVIKNTLKVFDPNAGTASDFSPHSFGSDNGSTPLLIDLDLDGYLDIVMVQENDPFNIFSKDSKMGITIRRIRTNIKAKQPIRWGAYMGSAYNGIF